MVCVVSPSLWYSFHPLRFYKNTEGHSQILERAGYPYIYSVFTYLDDGAASRRGREIIAASGFVAHPEKCCWEPTQEGDLLSILNLIGHNQSCTPTYRKTEG